ncbi:chitin binding domain-containing protein [Nocardia colli]|uniref:Chitin binding domain-containing protein n=1 Tax=Nocardia colli TaxID=2545717 RepID=A0A5N0EDA7_9NOCA|nr:chitin binding peritrophin-A domain-containing protein [Nocardia colli]KAA8885431.1 chitin binding domain-containing protein [Nocardia colli]
MSFDEVADQLGYQEGESRPMSSAQQYYADKNSPEWFWETSNDVAYHFRCPAGLWWDTKLLTCNYPEQAYESAEFIPPPDAL